MYEARGRTDIPLRLARVNSFFPAFSIFSKPSNEERNEIARGSSMENGNKQDPVEIEIATIFEVFNRLFFTDELFSFCRWASIQMEPVVSRFGSRRTLDGSPSFSWVYLQAVSSLKGYKPQWIGVGGWLILAEGHRRVTVKNLRIKEACSWNNKQWCEPTIMKLIKCSRE